MLGLRKVLKLSGQPDEPSLIVLLLHGGCLAAAAAAAV
jgi:hypothetical protein